MSLNNVNTNQLTIEVLRGLANGQIERISKRLKKVKEGAFEPLIEMSEFIPKPKEKPNDTERNG